MHKKPLTRFLMASLCLIFLISSCATAKVPAGFVYVESGEPVPFDAQCIDNSGARDISLRLEERQECLERLGNQPTFWQKFTSDFTTHTLVFGAGILAGVVLIP